MRLINIFQVCFSLAFALHFCQADGRESATAMDKNSNAVLVSENTLDTGEAVIQAAYMSSVDSDWSAPVILSDATYFSYSPKLALNTSGYGVAVWISYASEGCMLCAAILSGNNTWLSAKNLTQVGDGKPFDFTINISEEGKILVNWKHNISNGGGTTTEDRTAIANAITGNSSWAVGASNLANYLGGLL